MALALERWRLMEILCEWKAAKESAVQVEAVPSGSWLLRRVADPLMSCWAVASMAPKTSKTAGSNFMS